MSFAEQLKEEFSKGAEKETTTTETQTSETSTEPTEGNVGEPPKTQTSEPEPTTEPPKTQTSEGDGGQGNGEGGTGEPPKTQTTEDRPEWMQRAEFGFKRALDKQKRKHDEELAERDKALAEMRKELEELKKGANKEKPKTREDFEVDDDYIDYRSERAAEAFLNKFKDEQSAERSKAEAERKKAEEERASLEEQQRAFVDHIRTSFGEKADDANKFMRKLSYASKNGFGQILDNCPAASDFLMHNPDGPKVFDKVLSDKETFKRVFDNSSQWDIHDELKAIARELNAVQTTSTQQTMAKPAPVIPKIGKPGKQAGGATAPDIFSDMDAFRAYRRSHM